ncbi:TetR/AcrR family transcriptional regulator [Actinomadura sp. 6N118]|uniref:TetR/AcrR family transcriptional regulator n=1 Tax=Actinomadura sp. 6N118 TaxID=3375151 RepID=UPI003797E3DE
MSNSEKIIAAAIKHLNKEPTASMARLAEAIGTSRATLHRHFASREDLIHVLGERSLDSWEAAQNEARMAEAAASGDPEQIIAALRTLMRLFVIDADQYGFALTDYFIAEMPDLVARANELEEREVAFYAAAQRAGVLRSDLPVRWIGFTVYGLLVAARDSLRYGNVARRDLDQLVLETFLNGTGAGGTP